MPLGETMRMLKCDWVRLDRSRCHRDPELDGEQAEEGIYPQTNAEISTYVPVREKMATALLQVFRCQGDCAKPDAE